MGLICTCVCFILFQALGNENNEKKVYFLRLQNSQCFGCLHYLNWKLKLWKANLFMFVKDRLDFLPKKVSSGEEHGLILRTAAGN